MFVTLRGILLLRSFAQKKPAAAAFPADSLRFAWTLTFELRQCARRLEVDLFMSDVFVVFVVLLVRIA